MTSVVLSAIWLNVAANPSDRLELEYVGSFSRAAEKPARVNILAGGRRRVVRTAGVARDWSVSFPSCTPEQIEWLEDRIGQTMCVRDDRGHKVFVVFLGVPVGEHTYNHDGDVSLSLQEISFSEVA